MVTPLSRIKWVDSGEHYTITANQPAAMKVVAGIGGTKRHDGLW